VSVAPRIAARRARTVYALADAWLPPREADGADADAGGGALDGAPALAAALAALPPGRRRALLGALALLEHLPRLSREGRHGFAWMSREARRRWLDACARSDLPPVRRATARWRALVESAWRTARQSSPPAA
jgi:DNA-directed RNA polymerase specialized sigma24 family protein